eukprot:gene7959-1175_t
MNGRQLFPWFSSAQAREMLEAVVHEDLGIERSIAGIRNIPAIRYFFNTDRSCTKTERIRSSTNTMKLSQAPVASGLGRSRFAPRCSVSRSSNPSRPTGRSHALHATNALGSGFGDTEKKEHPFELPPGAAPGNSVPTITGL